MKLKGLKPVEKVKKEEMKKKSFTSKYGKC